MLRSLRARLIVLLALALLPASTLAIMQVIANYEQVKGLTERSLLQSSAIIASEDKNEVVEARDALETLAGLVEGGTLKPDACRKAVERLSDGSDDDSRDDLMVMRADGSVVCATSLETAISFAESDWFLRTLSNDDFTVAGNVVLSGDEPPVLVAAVPLHARSGEVVGVAGMALQESWLDEVLRLENGQPLANTSVALVDRRGRVLAEAAVGAEEGEWMPATFIIGARLSGQAQVFETEGRDGVERIFALAPLYDQQVYIVLGGVSGRLLTSPGLLLVTGLAYPILMWGIAIAVAWFAVDHLVLRQVLRLRKTANAYAEGHFEARTPGIDEAPEEIRELGETMHKMADVISLHESELRKSLQEQKILLREVYHRVKNNLQVVSSLVNLQVSRATNEHERGALQTTQDRIHALSMVHSNLYDTPELHRIKLQEFVPQLCEYLRQAQGVQSENVRFTFDIDPLLSEPEQAVPLALLITEVVTNALKSGWPEGEAGQLDIALKKDGHDAVVMSITDDGSITESASPESLGGRLIYAFARQLEGEVRVETAASFRLTLRLPTL